MKVNHKGEEKQFPMLVYRKGDVKRQGEIGTQDKGLSTILSTGL